MILLAILPNSHLMKPYVLLDRDGTLIEEKNYLADPDQVILLPGVGEGLHRLQQVGFGLAVLTNQSGIGRGYYTLEQMHAVNQRLCELLAAYEVRLEGLFFCPHAPEEQCLCRKPLPGMLLEAARNLNFDPEQAWVIGDKACDADLAHAAGARAILVRTGQFTANSYPDTLIADSFAAAVVAIVAHCNL